MPETITLTPPKTSSAQEAVESSTEKDKNRLSLLAGIRQKIASELKLTFTLPDPRREGLMSTFKNLALKGTGMAGVYVGKVMFMAGEQGHIMRSPTDTEQSFHHLREAVEGVGVGTMAMGALAIFLANRMRKTGEE